MTDYVTSLDGTRIAYDRFGSGPAIVLISGIFCDRQTTRALAEELAAGFSVINYDRRGRGQSGNAPAYAVEREVEDLAALINAAGGSAAVYGHSSGAGLALHAAARDLPITRLVVHEPPYSADDEESTGAARDLAKRVFSALDAGRNAEAIGHFFEAMGMPPEMVDAMSNDPDRLAIAPTMRNDFAVMGDLDGGAVPETLVRSIDIPTLVLAGDASPDFFVDVAKRIATMLPDGTLHIMAGQDHGAPADVVGPVIADFVRPKISA